MFPVVLLSQRNMAHMNNNMPKMGALQEKITDARRRGDMYEMAQLTQELQVFTTKKGINPIKNALPMFLQFPVFMSFFFGLRGKSRQLKILSIKQFYFCQEWPTVLWRV